MAVIPVIGMPIIAPGMAIAPVILAALDAQGETLRDGDVLVVAQKIVSKAEGRQRALGEVSPGDLARVRAEEWERPAELVELILGESSEVLRANPRAVVTRHRTGHVAANAGIDQSNLDGSDERALLWPEDPDASAAALREALAAVGHSGVAVIIADSLGRAWRIGTVGHAIGASGIEAVRDRRGEKDLFGRTLQATVVGTADSIAATAVLAMGEGDEGVPAVLVRGAPWKPVTGEDRGARALLRPLAEDMFR